MDYLWPCIVFSWLFYIWDTYLQWRQRQVYQNVTEVPNEITSLLDKVTFNKARIYQLDKNTFSLVKDFFKHLELMVILVLGGIPWAWRVSGDITAGLGLGPDYELTQSMVMVEVMVVYSLLSGLPWNIYSTFFLESRHGFNKQTPLFFMKDQLKALALELLIIPPITLGLLYTIQYGGRAFFVYAWLFLAAVTLLFVTVYQDFIAPLFDKFSPLPEGQLHNSICRLASSLSFPLKKIHVVEGSKRSAHSNAYLYGFWWNKVIVLFDTLLEPGLLERKRGGEGDGEEGEEEVKEEEGEEEKNRASEETDDDNKQQVVKGCNEEEVLAVLGHELGHWLLSHTLKMMIFSQVNLFLSLVLFAFFLEQDDVYTSFGFHDNRPILIGVILIFQLIFQPYNEAVHFILVQVVRRFEYQADSFARQLGRGAALRSALTKLNKDNLSFPVADPIFSAFNHTHPTFLERLKKLPKLD